MKKLVLFAASVLAFAGASCGSGSRATTGAGGSASTSSGAGGAAACSPSSVQGIAVTPTDVYGGLPYALGYPPYAIDGCLLAYVKPASDGGTSGDLVLRDLANGTEMTLAPASEVPRRPAIAGDLVAWEATVAGQPSVRVRGPSGVVTVTGTYDHAGEPRVAADSVVFTAWLGPMDNADTDVFLYTPSSGAVEVVATGPGQQRFADVSTTHVAWSDFSEGPSGVFNVNGGDAANIVVLDRAAQATTVRAKPGKQAFPMLGARGKVAYLDWGDIAIPPEPKFSEYDLRLGDVAGTLTGDVLVEHVVAQAPYLRPVARGAYLEWVETPGQTLLRRQPVDLSTQPQTVTTFSASTVFGPSASLAITLVGATTTAGAVTLRGFAR
jgi:hypothetical protein